MDVLYFVLLIAAGVSFVLAALDVRVPNRFTAVNFLGLGLALVTTVLVIQQGRLL